MKPPIGIETLGEIEESELLKWTFKSTELLDTSIWNTSAISNRLISGLLKEIFYLNMKQFETKNNFCCLQEINSDSFLKMLLNQLEVFSQRVIFYSTLTVSRIVAR